MRRGDGGEVYYLSPDALGAQEDGHLCGADPFLGAAQFPAQLLCSGGIESEALAARECGVEEEKWRVERKTSEHVHVGDGFRGNDHEVQAG